MIRREVELLTWSKTLMPALPVRQAARPDCGGDGQELPAARAWIPTLLAVCAFQGEAEMTSPSIRYVSVLDISERIARQYTGIGLVDFVTQRLIDKGLTARPPI